MKNNNEVLTENLFVVVGGSYWNAEDYNKESSEYIPTDEEIAVEQEYYERLDNDNSLEDACQA